MAPKVEAEWYLAAGFQRKRLGAKGKKRFRVEWIPTVHNMRGGHRSSSELMSIIHKHLDLGINKAMGHSVYGFTFHSSWVTRIRRWAQAARASEGRRMPFEAVVLISVAIASRWARLRQGQILDPLEMDTGMDSWIDIKISGDWWMMAIMPVAQGSNSTVTVSSGITVQQHWPGCCNV
ncbi:hypothetical protein BD779DRAFT_1786697 [Infundibulicybe gibba]|nr:hypothetical protein BD779DRAFT_1786697 [Infundibulicybe gibba]